MQNSNLFNKNVGKNKWNGLTKPIIYLCLIATISILLINCGSLSNIDTYRRLQVTHSLWMNVPQVKEDDTSSWYAASGKNEKKAVTWGLGQSLVMLPADVISYKLTNSINKPEAVLDKIRAGIVAYLTFTPINLLSIIISFFFLRGLAFNNKQSIFGSLTLLFSTSFLAYAQTHQENSLLFLVTLSGYALSLMWLLSGSEFILLLSAFILGFGILVRITAIFDILAVFLFVFLVISTQVKARGQNWYFLRKGILKYIFVCGPIYLFYLGLDRLYHWIRFGTLLGTYTSIWAEQLKASDPSLPSSFPFSIPFEVGFFGALFSPERSIFLFNPLLLITLILSIKYWQKIDQTIRAFIISTTFLLFMDISSHAKWFLWGGAASWGPRYLTTSMQMLSFMSIPLLISLYPYIKKGLERTFYKVVVLISVLIQLSSVLLGYQLELAQAYAFQRPVFVVGQRIINLIALLTGNFETWGLRPNNITSEDVYNWTIPRFMPWTISNDLPITVSYGFKIAWFLGLIMLIVLVFIFVKNTIYGVYDVPQLGSSQAIKEE